MLNYVKNLIPTIQHYPFILAFFLGITPALIWLWFWLKEDTHPESAKMISLSFLGGMVAVLMVLPMQALVYKHIYNPEYAKNTLSFALWATIEEFFKFLCVYIIALRNKKIVDEPIDDIIYLIIAALGFVTLENTLFLIEPIRNGNLVDTIISGNLRFLGASLVHVISSATIGVFMAVSFFKNWFKRVCYTLFGLILAVTLHTIFNLLIINDIGGNVFVVFGMVWIAILVLLLIIEYIKHITQHNQ